MSTWSYLYIGPVIMHRDVPTYCASGIVVEKLKPKEG